MTSPIPNPPSPFSTLVIASHNAGKVAEIGQMIAPLGIKALSAMEAGIVEPEETGDTFEANAALKAEHAVASCGLPSLADDSGLVVPAIGGQPGIYSARWAGPKKDFAAAFERIEKELHHCHSCEGGNPLVLNNQTPQQVRGDTLAYFVCVLALAIPGEPTHLFRGEIHGTLSFPPRGKKGFGYDPIFIPNGYTQTLAEIDPKHKNQISHRANAFNQFLQFLKEHT